MCGLAGYARVTASHEISAQLLDSMQQTLIHRGPNGSGTWISHEQGIGLAHRRLSIIDTSAAGLQPMISTDQSVVVSFNGEIYNHRALRQELESYGYVYRSHCDTETILYAYQQWGIECLQHFDGMFALIIVDVKKNELFLIRDRIGIKPFYFSNQGGMLSFASEIKALWSLPWMSKEIQLTAVSHYLNFLVSPAPLTLYQGVYKLPAGHYLKLDAQRNITFVQWYNLLALLPSETAVFSDTQTACVARIASLMSAAVEKRMMSDVPVGAFLSGGLDSSLIVALMARHTQRVKTFTMSFDTPDRDERQWARRVSHAFATDHHEIIINEQQAFTCFQEILRMQDEPIGDCVSIPIYCIAQRAKQEGIKVMLTGEGADELFCGYETYAKYLSWDPFWRQSQKYIPAYVRKKTVDMVSLFQTAVPARMALLHTWAQGQELFWSGATVFYDAWKKDIQYKVDEQYDPIVAALAPGRAHTAFGNDIVADEYGQVCAHNKNASVFTHITYRELKHRLPELLLTRLDKMTMAASIEGRVPFLDPQLVAYALTIPQAMQFKNTVTKYLLKKACEGILPDEIIYRKKIGFAAPVTHWFKKGTYFKSYFEHLMQDKKQTWASVLNFAAIDKLRLMHEKEQIDCGYQLWALQNLMATDHGT